MLQLDGKTLQYDRAFTHNGISYPANWLRLTTLAEKQAIGIVEVADTPRETWDQRFWWSPSNPKNLDDLKTLWKQKQNDIAGSLLAPSDWRVVKAAEVTTYSVETVWLTYRAAVRTACNTRQTEIDACSDVTELQGLINTPTTLWPTEP